MDIKIVALYSVYVIVLIADLIAGYFKVLPVDLVISTFTLVVGHFLGLQITPPTEQKTITTSSDVNG